MATQVNTFSNTSPLKTSIGDVLTNTNLGTINTKGADVPTAQQLKNAIKKANSQVDINSITISSITSTNAQVTGIGEYQGTTNVTFKVNKKMSITDVLQNTNLGEIETGNVTPNEKQLREAILVNNPLIVIDAVEISRLLCNLCIFVLQSTSLD